MVLTEAGNSIGTRRRPTYCGSLPLHFLVRPQTSCVRQLLLLGYRWRTAGSKVYMTTQGQCKWLHCNWLTWDSSLWLTLDRYPVPSHGSTSLATVGDVGFRVLEYMGLGSKVQSHSEVTWIYLFSVTEFGFSTYEQKVELARESWIQGVEFTVIWFFFPAPDRKITSEILFSSFPPGASPSRTQH